MGIFVLSVGGSIIAPDKVNSTFLAQFLGGMKKYLEENPESKEEPLQGCINRHTGMSWETKPKTLTYRTGLE